MRTYVGVAAVCVLISTSLDAQQDNFFDSSGVAIRYIEEGSGEPVILAHGIGGNLTTWTARGIFQDLARSYRVVAFDARGHGKSGKPRDPKQYGREFALDIVRLMDHLGISRAHIIGYSFGGITTSKLLTLRPDRFLSATQIAGAGRLGWTPELEQQAEREARERENECITRSLIMRNAPLDQPKPSNEELQRLSEACFKDPNMDRFAMAAVTRARGDEAVSPEDVVRVVVPTLGIVGSFDDNKRGMDALKKLRPAMNLVIVDGATHGGDRGVLTQAETLREIRAFLAAHRAGTN